MNEYDKQLMLSPSVFICVLNDETGDWKTIESVPPKELPPITWYFLWWFKLETQQWEYPREAIKRAVARAKVLMKDHNNICVMHKRGGWRTFWKNGTWLYSASSAYP